MVLAEEYNLELQYRKPFLDVWKEERNDPSLGPLSERMGVRGRDGGPLLVSDEELEAAGVASKLPPRRVTFVLAREKDEHGNASSLAQPQCQRGPLYVQVHPHDSTESIMSTVKSFYGIRDGGGAMHAAGPGSAPSPGVSFEDENGRVLIARYENFRPEMTVYVRSVRPLKRSDSPTRATLAGPAWNRQQQQQQQQQQQLAYETASAGAAIAGGMPREYKSEQPLQLVPGEGTAAYNAPFPRGRPEQEPSRRRRSTTTTTHRSRSTSNPHAQSHSRARSLRAGYGGASSGSDSSDDSYSDSSASPVSRRHQHEHRRRRRRVEQMPSSDISQENILQETRRKKPRFESSVSTRTHT
ncbi:mRNA cap guanine-N7 methyltransferase [Ascosphaera acerosa]|nr:mRNA cap guanine-N7 methyltransferase [Ascosphaera acerosa]